MVWYYLKWDESGQNQEDITYNEAKVYIENNKIQIYLLRFSKTENELENKAYCTADIDITYHMGDKPHFTYSDALQQEIEIEHVELLKF